MSFEIKPLAEREDQMERLLFDMEVGCKRVSSQRIEIGLPGQEPLVIFTPCMNHRVKHPIVFIRDEKGQHNLLSVAFREDLYSLKGSRAGDTELDLFEPIAELLKFDLGITIIASGYRGSMIMQTGFDEFTLQIEATPIARMHGGFIQPAGSAKVGCRGLTFYITVPAANDAKQFADFAQAMIPSFVAVSWSKERARRDKMRQAS